MPDASSDITHMEFNSNIEILSNGFRVDTVSKRLFGDMAATSLGTVNLTTLAATQNSEPLQTASFEGIIDEVELNITPSSVTCSARGRDNHAVSTNLVCRSKFIQATATDAEILDAQSGGPGFPEFFNVWPILPNTASTIAIYAANDLQLDLVWAAPSYPIIQNFDAIAPLIDVINTLLQPINVAEHCKVDIYTANNQIRVERRNAGIDRGTLPTGGTPAKNLNILSMTIAKRQLPSLRQFTIIGHGDKRPVLTPPPLITTTSAPGDEEGERISEDKTVTFLPGGLPDTATTVTSSSKYGAIKREYTTYRYAAPSGTGAIFGPQSDTTGIAQLLPEAELTEIRTLQDVTDNPSLPTEQQLKLTGRRTTSYAYYGDGKMAQRVTIEAELAPSDDDPTGPPVPSLSRRMTETFLPINNYLHQQITTEYSTDSSGRESFNRAEARTVSGALPGGVHPPDPSSLYKTAILTGGLPGFGGPSARDVSISNFNLDPSAIIEIFKDLYAASSSIEIEISAKLAGSIEFARGAVFGISDIPMGDGTFINTYPSLIIDSSITYDEAAAQVVTSIKAVAYLINVFRAEAPSPVQF